MKSRIGIVVPTGRYTPMLKDVLNSIILQDVGARIAVFDASSDPRTKALLETFSAELTYVHHGPDGGQANAIRMGWEHLDAEIVSWLNDDDFLAPGTLKKVIERMDSNPVCTGVFGPSVILDQDGSISGMHPAVDPKRLDEINTNNVISQPSCFVKYSKVQEIGGINKDLHFTMDWDLWTRLLDKFPNSFVFDENVLTAVTFSDQTKTAEISFRRLLEIYRVTRRYQSLYRSLKTVRSFFKWGLSQRKNGRNGDIFLKSPADQYVYWSYHQPIEGVTLRGGLSPQEIEAVETQNNMKLTSSENGSYHFDFEKHVNPNQLVRILLKNASYSEIKFRGSEPSRAGS